MGARIYFYFVAASLLVISCERKLGIDGGCYTGHYAMRYYMRPTEVGVSPGVWRGRTVLALTFRVTILASEYKNVEQFKALAAQRNDYSERLFEVCSQGPRLGCLDGMRSMRVLWPRAQGDTMDLSPAFVLEYSSYEDFIRRGYTTRKAPAVESCRVPVHELTGEHLQWLVGPGDLLMVQEKPVDIPFEEWDALIVRIEMDDGSRLPCLAGVIY